ncbi:MAG TPA: ABC transporter substrate-binding protein [Candidatus Dormibacteraeota bacterium]|jgi:peptide/nickel transport system substrate-binding protein|nr:ABC transporter substrate-binding protein [Candidatus Dormibacteraeota bacterium]
MAGLTVGATIVSACGGGGNGSGGGAQSSGSTSVTRGTYHITKTDIIYLEDTQFKGTLKESPALAALVKSGQLPPVGSRVPNPPYVEPMEWFVEGKYGGSWTWVCSDPTDQQTSNNLVNAMYGHSPMRWLHDGAAIGPFLASSWTWNSTFSELTLHFRKGLKWSDGQPWSVDDIIYWWEDEIGVLPGWVASQEFRSSKGTPVAMQKIDDVTLLLKYDAPTPLAVDYISMWAKRGTSAINTGGIGPQMMDPKHYLSQFHIKYNPSLPSDWATTYMQKIDWLRNSDNPTMAAWKSKDWKSGQYITVERNPYFWAIDKWGNQLPYIDELTNQNYQDPNSMRLAIQQGKADYVTGSQIGIGLSDVSTLSSTQGMELAYWDTADGTGSMYFFNYDFYDPKYRALFRSRTFQTAMSLAFNRERVRKTIYFEQGQVTSGTMASKAVEFHVGKGPQVYEQWRTAWVAHDPTKAGQMLDSIGLKKSGQWRTFSDGSPLQILIQYAANASPTDINKCQLLASDWQQIGINAKDDPVEPTSRLTEWAAGKLQTYADWGVGDGPNCLTYANWLVPLDSQRWAPMEGEWYLLQGTPQANAQANVDPWQRTPPNLQPDAKGPIAKLQALYRSGLQETDFMKRNQTVWEIMKLHMTEGPFFVGSVGNEPAVHMRNTDLMNVPRRDQTWTGGFVGPWTIVPNGMYSPYAWFWSDPSKH